MVKKKLQRAKRVGQYYPGRVPFMVIVVGVLALVFIGLVTAF